MNATTCRGMPGRRVKIGRIDIVPVLCAVLCSGCVSRMGPELRRWARNGERISVIEVHLADRVSELTANDTVMLLPLLADMPEDNRLHLQNCVSRETRNYLAAHILDVDGSGELSPFLHERNLVTPAGTFNTAELARLGKLIDATHVLCVRARNFRPYPPQRLSIQMILVDTDSAEPALEMNASFDASEQQVVCAAGDYLHARRAMAYDSLSLDTVLRSPSQYASFVASSCCRALADVMRNPSCR